LHWASFNLPGSFAALSEFSSSVISRPTFPSSSSLRDLQRKHRHLPRRTTCASWWSHLLDALNFQHPCRRPPNSAPSGNEVACLWQRGPQPTSRGITRMAYCLAGFLRFAPPPKRTNSIGLSRMARSRITLKRNTVVTPAELRFALALRKHWSTKS
jgi:hypothetical protein